MKKHKWEQDQISHMKEYIARFGHGSAKLARQAQSKEKTLEKMVRYSPWPLRSTARDAHLALGTGKPGVMLPDARKQ